MTIGVFFCTLDGCVFGRFLCPFSQNTSVKAIGFPIFLNGDLPFFYFASSNNF